MTIDYDHSKNRHSLEGAEAAIPSLFQDSRPQSLLDVGCGIGVWLRAVLEYGIAEVLGIDGTPLSEKELLVPSKLFLQRDLTAPWNLGRRFDVALCLEVGEHLDQCYSRLLVEELAAHADTIFFSAASPRQPGQHHVNRHWPAYWQMLFNEVGYTCNDSIRWRIWEDKRIEPWYRQNMFSAFQAPEAAGTEPRLRAVVHPDMLPYLSAEALAYTVREERRRIEAGGMRPSWYFSVPFKGLSAKVRRTLQRP